LKACRPSDSSSSLDSRRAERESRIRPWLIDGSMGRAHDSINHSKGSAGLQELQARSQARMDALLARRQDLRQPARTQATSSVAPVKAPIPPLIRSQVSRQARTQATTKVAPVKATNLPARSQVSRQAVRPQTVPTRMVPEKASRLDPVGSSRTVDRAHIRERVEANPRGLRDAFATRSSCKARSVAKPAVPPEDKPHVPRARPLRSEISSSSASSALPSGGQSALKSRRRASVAAPVPEVSVPKVQSATSPVDDSPLPAGVYEKVMRTGSTGPAYTLKKVSWKFGNGYENTFSPPRQAVVLTPEPVVEVPRSQCHVPITPAPRYQDIGKTPVNLDCARPRRRPMAPPLPVDPTTESVHWPERSETRLGAGPVAEKVASGSQMPGPSDRSRSPQLRHSMGSVAHRGPAHRFAVPGRPTLRTGPRMAKKTVVRFDDNVQVKEISRWMTDAYSDHRRTCGAITSWRSDAGWNPDPEHPSDDSHIRVWSSHPEDNNHHHYHSPGPYGFGGDGDPVWGNVSSCAPHLRRISWSDPCPRQGYKLPAHPELGEQGKCTCRQSGTYGCARKLYRKQLDLAYNNITCRGPNSGKLVVLRFVLHQFLDWEGGVAVIRS
jgi:hypothetical protein